MESVHQGWTNLDFGTNDFVAKMKNCNIKLQNGEMIIHPMGGRKISELQQALEEVQMDNNKTQEDLMDVSRKLQEAYKDEEDYWQQKNSTMWNTSRDLNTKFYHTLTKQRRTHNRIVGLHN